MKEKRVALLFGPMRQNVAAEHMAMAELEAADNVEMDDDGSYIKRPGFLRSAISVDSGSWTSGAGGATFDGVVGAAIDGAAQCWSVDTLGNARNRGTWERAYARSRAFAQVREGRRVVAVDVGSQKWVFVQSGVGVAPGYTWFILDTATLAVVRAPEHVSLPVGIHSMAVTRTQDNAQVWLLWATGSTTIRADKFTVASPGAPTRTTYLTTAGAAWHSVDALLQTGGEILVVAGSIDASTAKYMHSYLDTATGASKASPAAVVVSNATAADFVGPAGTDDVQQSVSILAGTLAGSVVYVVWDQADLKLVEANSTTLVASATTTLETATVASLDNARAIASGYIAANNDRVVFSSSAFSLTTTPAQPVIKRHTWNGASTTTVSAWAYGWVASRPAQLNSAWYVGTIWERNRQPTDEAARLQRTYYIRNNGGQIIARALAGIVRPQTTGIDVWPTTPDVQVRASLNRLDFGAMAGAALVGVDPTAGNRWWEPNIIRVTTEASERFGRPARYARGKVAVPGGIVGRFGAYDSVRELTPLMFPVGVTATAGTGAAAVNPTTGDAAVSGFAVVYRLVDGDGDIARSAPTIGELQFNDGGDSTIVCEPLRIGSRLTEAFIEFYVTLPGENSLRFLTAIVNDPTATTQSMTFAANDPTYDTAELLYTLGGALSNSVAPQAHAVAFWRERLHIASDDFVFSSDEARFGFAPSFSEFKRRRYVGNGEDITCIEPVDWNYLAAFKQHGIAVLSGPGPDQRGAGNYDLQELNTKKGVTRPRAVIQGPWGCHFTDAQDGQQCVITGQLQVAEVGDGVFDSRATAVEDVIHVEPLRQVWVLLASKMLVLDYAATVKDQPFGRWFEWSSSGITPAQAFHTDTQPIWIEPGGAVRRRSIGDYTDATSGAAASYAEKLRTGEFPFAGLGGEYDILDVLALLENVSGGTLAVNLTLTSDRAEKTSTPASPFSLATTRRRIDWKPNHMRVGGTKVEITDSASSTAGYRLVAIILTIGTDDTSKFPRTADRV